MAENKILCDNSVITRETPEYKELIATMRNTVQIADKLVKEVRPCLLNERYFTTEQVMDLFHISRRALQNYRDKGVMPFVSVGGTIVYPESKIKEMLEENYYKLAPFNKYKAAKLG
ncbi:helix-turn-helix domain-containing protein [uncultured Alistipes sp.]|uniref:helix-turn-helix domain-containing protein n=1 Tax=uncultured Alistipes sp. TaxID=538949 RepID=UPI0025902612|nr:helix-turn-helix domain-containing protein [uncultured Alistipes sp.]